ncbi:MAG: tRNA adenosine(34) deaminase TadA [Gemmatimonadaceae bacterium]|nr:tRNA adenosine(34) deaminase TadA [Gemmatimonadaceae bacterium]MCW5825015.1 tRNA adenosine(34) deaminase TadA [Gemmatimonadaceae bacterium]
MGLALAEAEKAARTGEVPVGAVLVHNGQVMARAGNAMVASKDATQHAELRVLKAAAYAIGDTRLTSATLYVTLEPCAMCAGAILHTRLARVVFGAWDEKAGMVGSIHDLLRHPKLNHRPEVQGGVREEDAARLLTEFFRARRGD